MPEYIERETLWRAFEYEPFYNNADRDEIVLPKIDSFPAADVAPVRHGRWLDGKCTVCGWEEPDVCTYEGYETDGWIETPYCPNCGCKMLEETMTRIKDYLSEAEILAQLAEEASELAQAALKMRRLLDGKKSNSRYC